MIAANIEIAGGWGLVGMVVHTRAIRVQKTVKVNILKKKLILCSKNVETIDQNKINYKNQM